MDILYPILSELLLRIFLKDIYRKEMSMNNEENLEKEISNLLEFLSTTEPGTELYQNVTEQLNTLYRLKIEEEVNKKKLVEKKDKIIDRSITITLELIGIILPICFYNKWMKMGLEFEKEGTFTSTTFRNLFSKFRPNKH
jgi:hypothetical protein